MTNYDKIKNMSIDEVANFILNSSGKVYGWLINTYEEKESYVERIKEWLNQEAKPTLLEAERVILENIDKDYEWIARDEGGYLYIHQTKPSKVDCQWQNKERFLDLESFNHLFQFIIWQDDEPYNIEELLNGKI